LTRTGHCSTSFRTLLLRARDFKVPNGALVTFAALLLLSYIAIYLSTPILLWMTGESDDGLDMALGRHLWQGEWLGPYNQFTLKKGPGYPAFLAVAAWLGISISLAHALLHCSVVTLFMALSHHFMKSRVLSALMFILLLWLPIAFTQPLLRVARNTIYYAQALLFIALLAYALFGVKDGNRRVALAGLSAVVLAWLWLTREDGFWIVPGAIVMIAAACFRGFLERHLKSMIISVAVMVVVFVAVQGGFNAANLYNYGKFVGVETKERNFQNALRALNSVTAGSVQPFIPVTRPARLLIYQVSPAFSSLAGYLDGPPGAHYRRSCDPQRHALPLPCDEIVAGWFLWALRDAAAWAGHYSSPAKASTFFRQISREVSAACAQRLLDCHPQLISEMPRLAREQIALIPSSVLYAIELLLFHEQPRVDAHLSTGDKNLFAVNLQFLNHPRHTPSVDIPRALIVHGWYYRSGTDWISARIRSAAGLDNFAFERLQSPDVAAHFHDAAAVAQRFVFRSACGDDCVLELSTPDGVAAQRTFAELRRAPFNFSLGRGFVQIETAEEEIDPAYLAQRQTELARRARDALVHAYSYILTPLALIGLVAFLLTFAVYWKQAIVNTCLLMAGALWLFVFCRIALLVLVDVTSFPAIEFNYLAPAHFLMVSASLFSIAAARQCLAGSEKSGASEAGASPGSR
jgi:hypothetical protein